MFALLILSGIAYLCKSKPRVADSALYSIQKERRYKWGRVPFCNVGLVLPTCSRHTLPHFSTYSWINLPSFHDVLWILEEYAVQIFKYFDNIDLAN